MRFSSVAAVAAAATTFVSAQAPSISDFTVAQVANGQAFQNISDYADDTIKGIIASRANAQCTYASAGVRQEWRTLSTATRKNFTDSVICLQKMKPQRMTSAEAHKYPGVKSRFDEYVATHINYTYNIHDTADFFAWHRAFIHFLEKDLQDLCGYTGVLPYWNWALDYESPQDSPIFSGDAFSMGSNGKFVAGRPDTWVALQDVTFPPGTGGGCVETGPFSNYTVNLGPLDLPNADNVNSSYQYNPRCLERDLNPFFSTGYNSWENVTTAILDNIYVEDFQWAVQGYNSDTNKFGIHGGGHWQVGGSMMDFHSSPSDPIFFLHHGMVDRVWSIWQNLDIYRRQNIINGTGTLGCSYPDCPFMKLTDELPFGLITEDQTFSTLMDTFAGPFCYRYDDPGSNSRRYQNWVE